MNNYLFIKNENYCRIDHKIINLIMKSKHEKIKCIWQSNNSLSKKTLMNKNEFKMISENFFESQSWLDSFFRLKNFSSAHTITSFFNLYIANNLNITQHVSTINMFDENRTLSSLKFMFDNYFTLINVNDERVSFDETRKIAQRARSKKSFKYCQRIKCRFYDQHIII